MKKALIWDGDNCLWNGTITEVGKENVTLPESRYALCKELCDRGIVQSVASYNNLEDVLYVIEKFNLTPFFVANQASFNTTKSAMINTIKENLNLAKESDIVFVDDQQLNLEEVKYNMKEINTILPEEIDKKVKEWFTKDFYTESDKNRVRRYKEEVVRKEASQKYADNYQDFLRECNIEINFANATLNDIDRIEDLLKRANRMSILAEPLTREDIENNLKDFYVIDVKDKFGEYGKSAFVFIQQNQIKALVISCRLQGKGIGSSILGILMNMRRGEKISSYYRETEYNQGMKSLFEWYKFEKKQDGDRIKFEKTVDKKEEVPNWIKINFIYNDLETSISYRRTNTQQEIEDTITLVENTKDTILSTYRNIWTSRDWWKKHPPIVAIKDNKIVGMHAYTFNERYLGYCKSYYMVVDENCRGQHIGGGLFLYTIIDANLHGIERYMTNSDERNNGFAFYLNFGISPITKARNEFNGIDWYFDFDIRGLTTMEKLITAIKDETIYEAEPFPNMKEFYHEKGIKE